MHIWIINSHGILLGEGLSYTNSMLCVDEVFDDKFKGTVVFRLHQSHLYLKLISEVTKGTKTLTNL